MAKYKPSDILRKFVLRQCIQHLVETSEHATWLNLTFWENVINKPYANKCWKRLTNTLVRENPDFRLVGVWARQGRGAWHIHAVCNQRFDLKWLQSKAMQAGFGQSFFVRKLDNKPETPEKIARYISGYITDKNGLDPVKDKGVRRTIFVGKHVKVVDMRYKSALKKITSVGREVSEQIADDEWRGMNDFEKQISTPSTRKKSYETWGDWYRRNRADWFEIGWQQLSKEEQIELVQLDGFLRRYLETGRWSYV